MAEQGNINKYELNHYRFKEVNKNYLVTTDDGSWIVLSSKEFKALKTNKIKGDLFSKLEDAGIIITEKNREQIINRLSIKYDFLFQGTALHIVIPTLRCNFNCIYCHSSSKPLTAKEYDMDEKTAKAVVDFIFQSPSHYITIEFQGGEPLLRFDIVKYIIEYAKKVNKDYNRDLVFTLVTNFSLMDEEKLNFLIENEVGICTSLDGSISLHNRNRPFMKDKESYSFVEKWVNRLHEEYLKRKITNRRANALITITKDSLSKHKEIIDEYVRLGLNDIFLRFLNNLGDARPVWSNISYTPEEFIEFWKKSIDYIIELNKKGVLIREWFSWIILQKLIIGIEPNYFEQRSPCGAVIGQLAYNYNGDIYSCDEARMVGEDIFKLGNVNENPYRNITTSQQSCALITSSINDTQICDFCAYKPYCGLCPVCNYAEHGSIISNILCTARCKIYKAQFDYIFEKIIKDKEAYGIFRNWLDKK